MNLTLEHDRAGPLSPPGRDLPSEGRADAELARHAMTIGQRTALGVLGDPDAAADVGQEVAIFALERVHTLRDRSRLDAWLDAVDDRHVRAEWHGGADRGAAVR